MMMHLSAANKQLFAVTFGLAAGIFIISRTRFTPTEAASGIFVPEFPSIASEGWIQLLRKRSTFMGVKTSADAKSPAFALCRNPKVMSTVLKQSFVYLVRGNDCNPADKDWIRLSYDKVLKKKCSPGRNFRLAPHLILNNNSDLVYLAVVRHPFDRLISGWLDKCNAKGQRCYGCKNDSIECFIERNYKYLLNFEQEPNNNGYFGTVDHFFPQTWMCELHAANTSPTTRMNVIAYSRDKFVEPFLQLLAQKNAPADKLESLRESMRTYTRHSTFLNPQRKYWEDRVRNNETLLDILYTTYYYDLYYGGYKRSDFGDHLHES